MISDDGSGRDLVARLDRANEEIDRLHRQLDRSGNVVRFRVTRHLESLDESAADLNARSRQMPQADTYERRKLERDLGSLEDQIAVTDAVFASATAEEQGNARQEMRADIRLLDVEAEADKRWWRRMFRRGRGASGRSEREREIEPGSTDEGGVSTWTPGREVRRWPSTGMEDRVEALIRPARTSWRSRATGHGWAEERTSDRPDRPRGHGSFRSAD